MNDPCFICAEDNVALLQRSSSCWHTMCENGELSHARIRLLGLRIFAQSICRNMIDQCLICAEANVILLRCPCSGGHAICGHCVGRLPIIECPFCRDNSAEVAIWILEQRVSPFAHEFVADNWRRGMQYGLLGMLQALQTSMSNSNTAVSLVTMRDEMQVTGLHVSAEHGHTSVVSWLLAALALVCARDWEAYIPLHVATLHGHLEIARMLSDNDSDLDAVTSEGFTPLIMAVEANDMALATMLIEHGAIIDRVDGPANAPIWIAADAGLPDMVELLGHCRANLDYSDAMGQTGLHAATTQNHLDVMRIMLQFRASANVMDVRMEVPLHIAARNGCTSMALMLLRFRARPNFLSVDSATPLDIALAQGEFEICTIIADYGGMLAHTLLQLTANSNSRMQPRTRSRSR